MIALALLLQAAPAAAPVTSASSAPPAESFSILAQPCAPIERDGREVVVCGTDLSASQRLPLPGEIVPNRPVPSNPHVTGTGALAADVAPCPARVGGCQVGIMHPIFPAALALIGAAGDALKDRREARAKKRDGDRRVPIDLAATGPAGRIEP